MLKKSLNDLMGMHMSFVSHWCPNTAGTGYSLTSSRYFKKM